MSTSFSLYFTPLAQSYLIEGNRKLVESELWNLLESEYQLRRRGNPDVWHGSFHTLTIEHARDIKELASKKKISEGKRVFVISTDSMTREAGNALLKTLEEPGEDTHFFIIIPSGARILPTILSRVRLIKHNSANASALLSPTDFIQSTPAERLQEVKVIMTKLENEEFTKGDISAFIEQVISKGKVNLIMEKKYSVLETMPDIASYSRDQSASLKMILEHVALVL